MDAPDLTGTTVLVVDDDEDSMDLFAHLLEQAGAVCLRAPTCWTRSPRSTVSRLALS